MNWALLPKASKAVLPVIAVYCNMDGEAFPSERTIAILAGCDDKTVRKGIAGLKDFPGFELSQYVTKRGRRAYKYKIEFPPESEVGRSIFFYRSVIDGGYWQELKQSSQALYPVMRHFGYFDGDTYFEHEEDIYDYLKNFDEAYKERDWDICEAEITQLARYADISRPSVYEALEDLEKSWLIEKLDTTYEGVRRWKIFVKNPLRYYNRDYLNKKVLQRYAHEINV